ncbi:hypothetical protein IAR50_001771 [Cryptococcus sp. DSM 104548]
MSQQNGFPYFNGEPGYAQQPTSQPVASSRPLSQPQAPVQTQDPATMLSVYPFMTYAPTARVAQHLSSHTSLSQPSPTAHEVYPHYAQSFERLEQPQTMEDWALRQASDMRVREVLEAQKRHGGSYGYSDAILPPIRYPNCNQAPPTPVSHTNPYGGHPRPQPTPYSFVPTYMPTPTPAFSAGSYRGHPGTPDSMYGESPAAVSSGKEYFEGFVQNTLARNVPQERAVPVHPQNGTPSPLPGYVPQQQQLRGYDQPRSSPSVGPLPYSQPQNGQGLPQYPQQVSYSQPQSIHQAPGRLPVPPHAVFQQGMDKSATLPLARGRSPSKRPSISSMAMRSPHPSSSVTSTPTHERVMSSPSVSSSPDPLGLPTPSPSKKPRKNRNYSPSLARNFPGDNAINIDSLSMREKSVSVASSASGEEHKPKIMLRIPMHLATPQRTPALEEKGRDDDAEGDEEEEGVDWGDEGARDAEGDWEMEEGYSSGTVYGGASAQVQMSGKTGERDTRNSWQKLQTLLEDISEENDSFTANPTLEDLQSPNIKFFAHVSRDGSQALLSQKTMSKVIRYVLRVQSGKKRQGQEAGGPEREWDITLVSTLLRLLERSIRDIENVVVFPEDRKAAVAIEEKSIKKKGKGKAESVSTVKPEESGVKTEIPLADIQACEEKLTRVKRSVAAAECSLILLDSEGLSKQLYSEELLSACVQALKDQLEQVVLPVIQGIAGDKIGSSCLARLVEQEHTAVAIKSKLPTSLSSHFNHQTLSSIAQSICVTLPRLTSLISRDDFSFSEGLLIQTVYLAKGPLFVVDPAVGKKKGDKDGLAVVKSMRMEGLSLLRGVFARYEEQRQWIIEEVLSSLVGQAGQSYDQALFQLSNGKSIHALSALLLQLIQASAFGSVGQVKRAHTAASNMEVLDKPETEKIDPAAEESRVCTETIESALRSATMVGSYILSKATTTRATKTSLDTDYKTILNLFISDLLAVLYRPEWPAASLFLSVFSKIMINSLDDNKTGVEATAAKGVALDYLADIAARLKSLSIEMLGEIKVATVDEIISEADVDGCTKLIKAQSSIRAFLTSAARDDGSFACSLDMASIMWAQELQAGVKKTASVLEKLAVENDDEAKETGQKLEKIGLVLSGALRGVWLADDSLFAVKLSDPKQGEQAVQASIAVSRGRSLQGAIDPIIHALLSTMSNTIIGLRTKALRGIGSIVMVDPDVLRLRQIRHALEDRLSDASPGVRDAAVELVGKYLVQKPELVTQYYHQVASLVMDTGLSVRKRVIKILKGIFATMENRKMQVDICCRMIALVEDRDPGIKSLSTKTLVDMLFSGEGGDAARLFVDILSNYRGSYEVLEKALDEVSKECESIGQKNRFGSTIDDLINRLIDATEENSFDSLSHIRAIWLLAESDPSQIDMQKANVLLGYLRPPANADDQATNELLLKVFQRSIPRMPRTASNFAQGLTKTLMPMISKPAGGFSALREIIGCFCAVTKYLTKDWLKAINVLRACEAKIKSVTQGVKSGSVAALNPAIAMMLYITALLMEGCDLDEIAKQDNMVDAQVRRISPQPLAVYFYELYLDFASMSTPHPAPTICLGALFRSYPSLLQRPETTEWMEKTFESNDTEGQCRLLGVLHQFLSSEVKKRANVGTAKKDVSLLIGNSKELQDSDYSTIIVQNNIEHIFKCARSQHVPTQNAALDVLTFVVNQGLYSPVHTVPILVTLETAEDPVVAERALALHTTLHDKHANLIHVLFMDSAKASYQYQRGITAEPSGHRSGVALLSSWYNMLSEKRTWRHDFLKALCRVFDSGLESEVDIGFVLYIAENLATMDYKLQEEPMTVVQALSRIVSTCSHLATLMEEAVIDALPEDSLDGKHIQLGKLSGETIGAERLADASIIVGLALMLKNHLVSLYHLQEDKCAAHVPGKKSATGDKAAQRRGMQVLDLNRMPMARGVATVGDFKQQQTTFLGLLQEDGALSENGD